MALETSLRGTVQISVRKGKQIRWPRAETPTHYIAMGLHHIAMGLHPDLNEAARIATRKMIDFLVSEKACRATTLKKCTGYLAVYLCG